MVRQLLELLDEGMHQLDAIKARASAITALARSRVQAR